MQAKRKGLRIAILLTAAAIFVVITGVLFYVGNYLLSSIFLIFLLFLPFLYTFEKRRPDARELVIIAVMITSSVVGRLAFQTIPSFTPVTALVIITAVAFGSQAGFLTGTMTALVSNLYISQGLWTPWQMLCWGFIGYFAGFLSKYVSTKRPKSIVILLLYGIFTSYLFCIVMNCFFLLSTPISTTGGSLLSALVFSFPFDIRHVIATSLFLGLSFPILKNFERLKHKYGIGQSQQ